MAAVGLGAGSAVAAPAPAAERATTISNDLVEIEPAKVHGTYTDPATGEKGKLVGKFMPTRFVDEDGALAVEGVLTGVLTGKLPEGTPRHVNEDVTMTVTDAGSPGSASTAGLESAGFQAAGVQTAGLTQAAAAGCDVLNLDLGPLDLNLLGLQIDLAPVVLDIVAQPGAGALLGNLLCAVAGLLDSGTGLGGLLDGLVAALNGLLGGLLDLQAVTGLIDEITGVLGGATQTRVA